MNAGEFFVSIGITGADKTISSLEKIDKLLKDIRKNSNLTIKIDTTQVSRYQARVSQGASRAADRLKKIQEARQKAQEMRYRSSFAKESKRAFNEKQKELRDAQKRAKDALKEQDKLKRLQEIAEKAKEVESKIKDTFNQNPSDKTSKGLITVGNGLKDIVRLALQAKVALFAVGFGLANVFGKSGQKAANLENLGTIFNTDQLQRFQQVAARHGVSPEEITQTFYNIKNALQEAKIQNQWPPGWNRFLSKVGTIDPEKDIQDFIRHPEKLIKILQTYAARETFGEQGDVDIRDWFLRLMATSGVANLITQGVFTEGALKSTTPLSKQTIAENAKVKQDLEKVKQEWQTYLDEVTAKFGRAFIEDLKALIPELRIMVSAILQFIKDFEIFKHLGLSLKGLQLSVELLTDVLNNLRIKFFGTPQEKQDQARQEEFDRKIKLRELDQKQEELNKPLQKFKDFFHNFIQEVGKGHFTPFDPIDPDDPYDLKSLFPKPDNMSRQPLNTQSAVFHQTFNFTGRENASEIAFEVKKVIEDAFLPYHSNVRVA